MQTTSATWKALAATGTAILETRAIINGTEYLQMTAPTITRALMQGGLSIGNVVSATCKFSILTTDDIPRAAEVIIEMRLTDGETASEWLPAGTFFISHRDHDRINNILTLECYDALLKANSDMPKLAPWTDEQGRPIKTDTGEMLYFSPAYPRPMFDTIADIAALLGVELDPRTDIDTGAAYTIPQPMDGSKIRDLLAEVATAHGGNWIITPANKLRLVPIISADDAPEAEDDVIDVTAVLGSISATVSGAITGIRIRGETGAQIVGDDTGIVLDANVTPTMAESILDKIGGRVYRPFELPSSIYDPAVELGDFVRHGELISSVLYSEEATLGLAFRGDIAAPESEELADEYPYIGSNMQAIQILSGSIDVLGQSVQELDESVQTINEAVQTVGENVQELEESKADVEEVVQAQETAETARVLVSEIQNQLGLWFTFDADRGLIVQKKDDEGNPISIWSTVTDEIGYHIQRQDLQEYVFSAYRDRVKVQNLEIGNIIIKSSSNGGHIWTRK